jgi:hypothetical protein
VSVIITVIVISIPSCHYDDLLIIDVIVEDDLPVGGLQTLDRNSPDTAVISSSDDSMPLLYSERDKGPGDRAPSSGIDSER